MVSHCLLCVEEKRLICITWCATSCQHRYTAKHSSSPVRQNRVNCVSLVVYVYIVCNLERIVRDLTKAIKLHLRYSCAALFILFIQHNSCAPHLETKTSTLKTRNISTIIVTARHCLTCNQAIKNRSGLWIEFDNTSQLSKQRPFGSGSFGWHS